MIITLRYFLSTLSLLVLTLSMAKAQEGIDFGDLEKRNIVNYRNEVYQINQRIYLNSIKYRDYKTAKNSLYTMLSFDSKNEILLFNLAYIYFDNEEYESSVEVLREVMDINSNNYQALELLATSYTQLEEPLFAASTYENLYLQTQDINFLYRLAFIQYDLKNFEEAKVNTDIILKAQQSNEIMYRFEVGKKKKEIEVSMATSVLNLKGRIAIEQGDKKTAKSFFIKCLKLSPEFEPARKGLKSLGKWKYLL